MKNIGRHIALVVVGLVVLYVGSYVALRCSVMRLAASGREIHGKPYIKTWVYFGDGDNLATRMASSIYFPIVRLEFHCSRDVAIE